MSADALPGAPKNFSAIIEVYAVAFAAIFVGFAAAQSGTNSGALPIPTSNIPECILTCVSQSATSAGCSGLADTNCICTSTDFLTAATTCITTNCPDLATQAIQLQSQLCEAGSPSGSQSASATASASSTSRAASSTATAPASSASVTSHASGSSHASSAISSASSVLGSLTSAAASATTSPNSAVGLTTFNFAAAGVWAMAALGGAVIAQFAL
ncbi:CFEM domain protein [Ceratobasidium sp. AG-Ba]|nr:CFEM domain protein [Ceratobasidium sp. AG-Ba]